MHRRRPVASGSAIEQHPATFQLGEGNEERGLEPLVYLQRLGEVVLGGIVTTEHRR